MVGVQNPQNFRLRRSKIPYKMPMEGVKILKYSRLRRAYSNDPVTWDVPSNRVAQKNPDLSQVNGVSQVIGFLAVLKIPPSQKNRL